MTVDDRLTHATGWEYRRRLKCSHGPGQDSNATDNGILGVRSLTPPLPCRVPRGSAGRVGSAGLPPGRPGPVVLDEVA